MIETMGLIDLAGELLNCVASLALVVVAAYLVRLMRVMEEAELRNRGDVDDVYRESVG